MRDEFARDVPRRTLRLVPSEATVEVPEGQVTLRGGHIGHPSTPPGPPSECIHMAVTGEAER